MIIKIFLIEFNVTPLCFTFLTHLRAALNTPATKIPGIPCQSPSMSITSNGRSWSLANANLESSGSQSWYLANATKPLYPQMNTMKTTPKRKPQRVLKLIEGINYRKRSNICKRSDFQIYLNNIICSVSS